MELVKHSASELRFVTVKQTVQQMNRFGWLFCLGAISLGGVWFLQTETRTIDCQRSTETQLNCTIFDSRAWGLINNKTIVLDPFLGAEIISNQANSRNQVPIILKSSSQSIPWQLSPSDVQRLNNLVNNPLGDRFRNQQDNRLWYGIHLGLILPLLLLAGQRMITWSGDRLIFDKKDRLIISQHQSIWLLNIQTYAFDSIQKIAVVNYCDRNQKLWYKINIFLDQFYVIGLRKTLWIATYPEPEPAEKIAQILQEFITAPEDEILA